MSRRKSKPKGAGNKGAGNKGGPEELMRMLHARMEAEKTAEGLNDNVIIPFMAALEDVSAARGYLLNIHGERANVVFSGSDADAAEIYRLVEEYLAAKDGGAA